LFGSGVAPGYLAEYLVVQVWVSPYRFKNDKKTVEINHTRRSNTPLRGWTVCKSRLCGFASQKHSTTHNLQTAVVLNVNYKWNRNEAYNHIFISVCGCYYGFK
jgi:hypothetical protein